jgi:malate:Na+ symporter
MEGNVPTEAAATRQGEPTQSLTFPALARALDLRIGIVPLAAYPLLLLLLGVLAWRGKLHPDLTLMIPTLALGAFTTAELGHRLPLLRQIGGPAILTVFLPSYLVYAHLLPDPFIKAITEFTRQSNFLYLFIASIIVGSILGMERRVLIAGFLRIFVPLFAGSLAALVLGTLAGLAAGLGLRHTIFFIVVPIMGGGVGEGALPLSLGYAGLLHASQGELFAEILPAVLLGNLAALLLSGGLAAWARRRPHLTGYGLLTPLAADDDPALSAAAEPPPAPSAGGIAAAGLLALALYLVGVVVQELSGFPAPVLMLALAVGLKLIDGVSAEMRGAALTLYQFFAQCVTYPLIFAIGVAMTPWSKLIGAFTPATLWVVAVTVGTLMAVGFVTGRLIGLYPVEAAIVNACHSGQGGTGDVMILTAAERMPLMPFAQIATRIGGAITVTLALTALRFLS